jgi:hypothetical protein
LRATTVSFDRAERYVATVCATLCASAPAANVDVTMMQKKQRKSKLGDFRVRAIPLMIEGTCNEDRVGLVWRLNTCRCLGPSLGIYAPW